MSGEEWSASAHPLPMDEDLAAGPPGPEEQQAGGSSSATAAPGQRVDLKVKTMEPATYELSLTSTSTVAALKGEVERASGVDAARQRILFCGRVLSDGEKTLEESGVKDGHTLHMVERPPDVPPQPQNDVPPPPPTFQPPSVQRIAIGTINTSGLAPPPPGDPAAGAGQGGATGAAGLASAGNVDRLLSGLMSAIGNSLGRGAPGVGGAGMPGAQGTFGAPPPPPGTGQEPGGGAGAADPQQAQGGAAGQPSVQVQQVEINIDAVPAGGLGLGAGVPNLGLHSFSLLDPTAGGYNHQTSRHPFVAANTFIQQLADVIEGYRMRANAVVDRDRPCEGTSNPDARHLAGAFFYSYPPPSPSPLSLFA